MSKVRQSITIKFQEFLTKLLVRCKRIKRAPVKIEDIESLINQSLPQNFEIATPGGNSEFSILGVTLSIPKYSITEKKEVIHAEIFCNFSVNIKQSIIYNTHLMLTLEASPNYHQKTKKIGVADLKITDFQLISDQCSLIKDVNHTNGGLLSKSLGALLNVTASSTKAILNNKTMSNVTKYLSLYTSGSKQLVIDYHRPDIERKIIEFAKSGALNYQLNESVFEEKLFADYGEKIVVEKGALFFVFKT